MRLRVPLWEREDKLKVKLFSSSKLFLLQNTLGFPTSPFLFESSYPFTPSNGTSLPPPALTLTLSQAWHTSWRQEHVGVVGQETYSESGKHDVDQLLWSFTRGCRGLHHRRLLGLFRNGTVLPSTQKSKKNFHVSHIIHWIHAAYSHWLLSADLSFLITYLQWKRKTRVCSHISGPITLEHLSLTLCLPKLQAIHSEHCFVQSSTSLRAQYLLTA